MKKTTLKTILNSIDEFIKFNDISYNNDVITLRHTVIMQYVDENGLTENDYFDLCDELD
jgi:hypothetical protein